MSTAERPAKRARQACDPCRRKKSRCPGERPRCSYCARLNQQCAYSNEGLSARHSVGEREGTHTIIRSSHPPQPHVAEQNDTHTNYRLSQLEAKLSEVLLALHDSNRRLSSERTSPIPTHQITQTSMIRSSPSPHAYGSFPSYEALIRIEELYMQFCHCQPLPMFAPSLVHSGSFATRLHLLDEEVVLAVSALSLRFSSDNPAHQDLNETIRSCFEKARSLVMQRVNQGLIELSTLQSLCLLGWLDFYDGNLHRASMYVSLVSNFCKSSNLADSIIAGDQADKEKVRCFWSIILLQRLHSNISGPFQTCFDKDGMPGYPESPSRPPLGASNDPVVSESRVSDHKDLGIVAYAIRMTEVWHKVARYAHRRASAGPYPPWSPKSDYAMILAHQMDSETSMPYAKHRFKPARFEDRTPEELAQHRSYWSPWLFTQMLYHTSICVLNHPLLLSLRLKKFRVASVPEIWLQHADDLITQHTQWIIHIIELLDAKSFLVTDPFLAHCVAIVATIYLQQSFSDDENVQQIKKDNFAKCLAFCRKIGQKWPYIQRIAIKLEEFERVVSSSYFNSATSRTNDKILLDLSLFWEILESSSIGKKSDINGLKFGSSLNTKIPQQLATEELNARLLPETSRITAAGSPMNGTLNQSIPLESTVFTTNGYQYSAVDDFNVLAQSYFAQGQDFVGNMDDWWLAGNTNATI